MTHIQIKHHITGAVLFEGDYESMKECVVAAVKARAYLARAYLAGANLAGANLARANLARANLAGADLAGANLAGAYLADANLARADLAGANLAGAYLVDANLARANLARAYLVDAYLAGADLAGANLAGAYLADANLARANLVDANLVDAYLVDANLADANLARAYLAGAYLAGADLAGANLAGAYLAGANLAGARNVPAGTSAGDQPPEPFDPKTAAERRAARMLKYREMNPDVPVVEALDAKILQVIESGGGRLAMNAWHTCETTHCRAGWAITLAGPAGRELESVYGPERAGTMIYRASTGRVPHFFASDERALEDIREQAALQAGAAT